MLRNTTLDSSGWRTLDLGAKFFLIFLYKSFAEQYDSSEFAQFPSVVVEDCFKIFKEKGLHFLHLNVRSL
jgi:hypothetical protein